MVICSTVYGSGGMKATIVVTAPTGSTVTCDGITGEETSGTWSFSVGLGAHAIEASLGTKSKEKTVLVDQIGIFEVEISYGRLPVGYEEVAYIESHGTEYIDTGIVPSGALGTTMDVASFDNGQDNTIFGSGTRASVGYYGVNIDYGYEYQVYWGGPIWTSISASEEKARIEFNLNGDRRLKVDGSTIYTVSGTPTFSKNVTLFCFSYTSMVQFASIKMYGCEMYSGESQVRNFVPAIRLSDEEVGLYDLVTDVFYENLGTGAFTAGPTV